MLSARVTGGSANAGHEARVEATVVRVFSADQQWLGRKVTCVVPVVREGEDPPPGGFFWQWESLQSSRFLEAVLAPRAAAEGFDVVYGLGSTIHAPTNAPVEDYRTWADGSPGDVEHRKSFLGPVAWVLGLAVGAGALVWAWW